MGSKTTDWRPGPTVCRCCLSEGCYKDISTEYFWMGKREVYAEMLSETFSLSIAYSQSGGPNSNSRLICEPCISRLRDASDFRKQVQECEKTFMQYLDPGTSVAELEVTVEPVDTQVKVERVKLEKAVSDDDFDDRTDFREDDDDDDDLDDQPLTKLASKVPKKESVDILDLLDNAKVGEKRKSSSKAKTPVTKKSKTKKEAKATSSKAPKPEKKKKGSAIADTDGKVTVVKTGRKVKENVSERQLRRRRRANNELPEESEKRIAKTMMRRNAMILLECSTAWAFRWFQGVFYCSYCETKFADIDPLRQHVQSNHSSEPPTKNVFAKIKENNMLKIDIDCLTCRLCKVYIQSIDALKEHLQALHGPEDIPPEKGLSVKIKWKRKRRVDEDKANAALILQYSNAVAFRCQRGKFMCAYCQNICPSISELRIHSIIHDKLDVFENPDIRISFPLRVDITDLTCTICNETVLTIADLKTHLSKDHDKPINSEYSDGVIPFILSEKEFKCVHCGVTFERILSLFVHMNKHYQSHVCPTCGKGFSGRHKLRSHLTCHESGQFACPKCDLVFANRASKNRHMSVGHGRKERYRCPVCDAYFDSYHSRLRHLDKVHDQKVEYRCSLCPSIFGSSTLRHSHMSIVHLRKRKGKK